MRSMAAHYPNPGRLALISIALITVPTFCIVGPPATVINEGKERVRGRGKAKRRSKAHYRAIGIKSGEARRAKAYRAKPVT